jgi:hypothetical protein
MTGPELDPETSLAFALASGPGRYALLLGSGVSSAAGIPTGWQVVERLIEHGGRRPADPRGAGGVVPGSVRSRPRLFGAPRHARPHPGRAITASALFLPTEEERAEGLKSPTPAHRAIARLVRDGASS